MERKIAQVLWGDDHYEETLEEMIHYMIEYEELTKDEIVGMEVEFCEEANVYSYKQLFEIEDILCGELEFYEGDYFEKAVGEVLSKIKDIKYHSPFQKYVITEDDFEEVVKKLKIDKNHGKEI
jgi:hypothetical protein